MYPRNMRCWATETVTSSSWLTHAQTTISGSSSSAGIAIPIFGDGTAISYMKVRVQSGSQAGTLHAEIQSPSLTPDVNNISGLPDGTAITNGTANTASVTGGVNEVLTLTWSTPPTPVGLHWLVITGSSGGTVDIEISYTNDYTLRTLPFNRISSDFYYDGVDWNNAISVGTMAVMLFKSDDTPIGYFLDRCPPYFTTSTDMLTQITLDNKECVGFKFTAKTNLTKLTGVMWPFSTQGGDMNMQMRIYKSDGTAVTNGISSTINQQILASGSRQLFFPFDKIVTLTAGTEYRIFLCNPDDTVDDIGLLYWDLSSADDQATYFDMDSGEWALSTATDPPEYGASGTGTWTDENTKLVFANLIFEEDVTTISGGGATQTSYVF